MRPRSRFGRGRRNLTRRYRFTRNRRRRFGAERKYKDSLLYSDARQSTGASLWPQTVVANGSHYTTLNASATYQGPGQSLVLVPRNTGVNDRLTDKIVAQRITIKGRASVTTGSIQHGADQLNYIEADSTTWDSVYKKSANPFRFWMYVIHDKQWNSGGYVASGTLGSLIWRDQSQFGSTNFRNLEYTHRFNVLKKIQVNIPWEATGVTVPTATTLAWKPKCVDFTCDVRCRIPIRYKANSADGISTEELTDDNIFAIIVGDQNGGSTITPVFSVVQKRLYFSET